MGRAYFSDDFVNLRNRLDQPASGAYEPLSRRQPRRGDRPDVVAQPIPVDIYATHDAVVIVAAVPGMRPEDLDLTIHQDTVTLSGTVGDVMEADEATGATWYRQELGSGAYRRQVTVPFPVDAERADASYQYGMLRVVLPKAEQERPHTNRITGSSPNPAERT